MMLYCYLIFCIVISFGIFGMMTFLSLLLILCLWIVSTYLTHILPDFDGSRYSSIQIRSIFCMDNFAISCCICCFHISCNTGMIALVNFFSTSLAVLVNEMICIVSFIIYYSCHRCCCNDLFSNLLSHSLFLLEIMLAESF